MMIMTGHTLMMMMMMMSGLFVRNGHPSPIPTMLAPRIEPTAVHMPGLFRKLCERSLGTMEEDNEVGKVGKVGSYWTANTGLHERDKKKILRLRLRHFYVYQKVCDVKTYKVIENHYGRRFFLSYILKSFRRRRESFFSFDLSFFFLFWRQSRKKAVPLLSVCVATSKFNMRVNIYAIAYYSGVSYLISSLAVADFEAKHFSGVENLTSVYMCIGYVCGCG